ncbi:serine-threonine protein kinase [Nocardia sp. NPDC057353]|uniref:serine-threonine protein kinase n=1 Tax=Nocardia sp. NPDC057353 TaxID=3346104 RepID=UPI003640D180
MTGDVFEQLVFDEDGDPRAGQAAALRRAAAERGRTDLFLFCHGWNNGQATAVGYCTRWFAELAAQLDPAAKAGFAGVFWPSQLWRDEPIPDFPAAPDGAAALTPTAAVPAGSPELDPGVLAELRTVFPGRAAELDAVAALLAAEPSTAVARELFDRLRALHDPAGLPVIGDGESADPAALGMFAPDTDPVELFERFADELETTGVELQTGSGGAAGFGGFGKLLHGAKEALRQLSYWRMKNRAGVVGRAGLGPAITELAADGLRIHLIGHSFGGRVVSFALDGLGAGTTVASVTLLQAAFSRFTFTDPLPFRPGAGALAGRLDRIDGPLTVCFSEHDSALGVMYPLASLVAGADAADADDPLFRYRALGSHGAYQPHEQGELGASGTEYPFAAGRILNLDASGFVTQGGPPGGAHSDIFKPELGWVVAAASGLARDPG